MNTVSRLGSETDRSARSKPAALGRVDHARHEPLGAFDVQLDAALDHARARDLGDRARQALGERLGSPPVALTVTIVSAPTDCFSAAGRVEREDLAVVHDRHPIAELVGLLHVVGRQQDRLPLAVQLAEDLPQRQAALRVQARGRLVEEQHRRAVEDRARHHQPLGHPARERVDRRLGPFRELELLEQLIGDAPRLRRADAEQAAVEVQVLPHGQLPVERVLLGDDPDQLLGERGMGDDVDRADVGRRPRWGSRAW